ncbi:hypothetical protein LguiB_017524 [Lonicera macranthoides]
MSIPRITLTLTLLLAIWAFTSSASGAHHAAPAPSVDCLSVILNLADCFSFVTADSTVKKPQATMVTFTNVFNNDNLTEDFGKRARIPLNRGSGNGCGGGATVRRGGVHRGDGDGNEGCRHALRAGINRGARKPPQIPRELLQPISLSVTPYLYALHPPRLSHINKSLFMNHRLHMSHRRLSHPLMATTMVNKI